jgi:hypothetical protein
MKVKLLTGVAGPDFSYSPGETVDLDDDYAQRMIDSGQAEAAALKPKKAKNVSSNSNA